MGSFIREIGARGDRYHEIRVHVVTLDSILKKNGVPYYLKIDIEGMDNAAVQAIGIRKEWMDYLAISQVDTNLWYDIHARFD